MLPDTSWNETQGVLRQSLTPAAREPDRFAWRPGGQKHAANDAMVITASAEPNASGSRGLTLYKRFPSSRVNPSAGRRTKGHTAGRQPQATWTSLALTDSMRPPKRHTQPQLARALRHRVRHHPYNPMTASSSASPPKTPTKVTATICGRSSDRVALCSVITSKRARFPSRACTSRVSAFVIAPGSAGYGYTGPPRVKKFWRQRHIEKGLRRFANALVLGILRNTDHLHPSALDLNPLAYRILAAPIPCGHRFVRHGNQGQPFRRSARVNSRPEIKGMPMVAK